MYLVNISISLESVILIANISIIRISIYLFIGAPLMHWLLHVNTVPLLNTMKIPKVQSVKHVKIFQINQYTYHLNTCLPACLL